MPHLNRPPDAMADRLLIGANALAIFAEGSSDAEWNTPAPGDGRTIGVAAYHVASVYPIEMEPAQIPGNGDPITDVS